MNLKPITISLSPNTEKDDISLAFKLLFRPWLWKKGEAVRIIENKFKEYFKVNHAISFNSGRSALFVLLKALNIEKDGEVLLQAFTCNAASNPIIWSGLKPVYVDCNEETFNIDLDDLKRKTSSKSKVLIVQHTFGLPADMEKIVSFCQENNLILIEDCAHALGADIEGKKIGTFGKAAFFSFSRDKIISSVYGGMLVTSDPELCEKIYNIYKDIKFPTSFWIKQQLLHPIFINFLILPTYRKIGKYLLVLAQKVNILSKAVHFKEKRGERPSYFPRRLPNALAILAVNQFNKIEKFNAHRKLIAQKYRNTFEESMFQVPPNTNQTYLRFTLKHPRAHKIIRYFWENNILIGDWYTSVLAPKDTNLEKLYYQRGSCPKAESLATMTFNLPTHINISDKDADRIIALLNQYGSKGNKK